MSENTVDKHAVSFCSDGKIVKSFDEQLRLSYWIVIMPSQYIFILRK